MKFLKFFSLSLLILLIGCGDEVQESTSGGATQQKSNTVQPASQKTVDGKSKGDTEDELEKEFNQVMDSKGDINKLTNGLSLLHKATVSGKIELVKRLVHHGANINISTDDACGLTALHVAIFYQQPEIAKELIALGADVNALNKWGASALFWATRAKQAEVVKALIAAGARDKEVLRDPHLSLYVQKVAPEIDKEIIAEIKELIRTGEDLNKGQKLTGRTPLHIAADIGNIELINELINHGADINARDKIDSMTPLHIAASKGQAAAIRELINKGTRVDVKSESGSTPLEYAIMVEHAEAAKALIAAGADINLVQKLGTGKFLQNIIEEIKLEFKRKHAEQAEVVKNLVTANTQDIDEEEAIKEIKELVKAGVNLNKGNETIGQTRLHKAAAVGNIKMINELINHGADTNARDKIDFMTPLHIAASKGQAAAVQELINQGADVDVKSKSGSTPLEYAIMAKHAEAAKVLIAAGANTNLEFYLRPDAKKFFQNVIEEVRLESGKNKKLKT